MANILTIIPYSFYPPTGGGALRCFHILREMAKEHVIYVISLQSGSEFALQDETIFNNIHLVSIKEQYHYKSFLNFILPTKYADALNYRFLRRRVYGSANHFYLNSYPSLSKLLKQVKFDLINYESLEALSFFRDTISRFQPDVKHLYDAHNIDSDLWKQQAKVTGETKYEVYANNALDQEKNLNKEVDITFCCSIEDKSKLEALNNNSIKCSVVHNGVDTASKPYYPYKNEEAFNNIIFCGSLDYLPNKEGLIWFHKNVFPILKLHRESIRLTVIGNCSSFYSYKGLVNDSCIDFIGRVDAVEPYYENASVAIVPLLSGSGTRLKILEAMSLGNPVVSTSIGAEGLEAINGVHLRISDSAENFATSILDLLNDSDKSESLRAAARKFVEDNYDWSLLGKKIREELKNILHI